MNVDPTCQHDNSGPKDSDGSAEQDLPSRELVILVVDDNAIDRHLAGAVLAKGLRARLLTAENGQVALDILARESPDLVLTDLQMPLVDGLTLVRRMRACYPSVPTILMTAHGSEEIALEALQVGAASYVAKRNIQKSLVDTVREVVSLSGSGRTQRKLFSCWGHTEFEFYLENDTSLIPPLVTHLQQYSSSIRPRDETDQLRVNIALHEALRNAMHHGNLELSSEMRLKGGDAFYEEAERRRWQEPYKDRRVYFLVKESPEQSFYLIRDEGHGFDVASMQYDPTDPLYLERPSGRGLFLMRTFMDDVRYNDQGNEIVMIRGRQPQSQAIAE